MARRLPAPDIPQRVEELSPDWLTAVLRQRGVIRESRVIAREPQRLGEGEGFVGQIVRLRLDYDRLEAGAPDSVIAKLPIGLDRNRQLGEALGAYEREVRFYGELADAVPIPKPVCYHASMDPNPAAGREQEILDFLDRLPRWLVRILVPFGMWLAARSRRRYLLLLEDLAPARRLGDQVAGCTREEAESVLRHIAVVHARWWQHGDLGALGWVPPVYALSRYLDVLYRKHRPGFFAGFGASLPPRFVELADWLQEHGPALTRRIAEAPCTLLHGDYRLDNIFLQGEGVATRVTAFDWQSVCRGPGALDAAYFVSGNLPEAVAAGCERQLVSAYHEALREHGVDDYDFEACLRDYRLSMLFVVYRVIAGAEMIDFSSGRGDTLIRGWTARLEALMPEDYRELVTAA